MNKYTRAIILITMIVCIVWFGMDSVERLADIGQGIGK